MLAIWIGGGGMTTREEFVAWFGSLSIEEAIDVWYDCDALTHGEFARLTVARLDAARVCVDAAKVMRSWYGNQVGPGGPEVAFDEAVTKLEVALKGSL